MTSYLPIKFLSVDIGKTGSVLVLEKGKEKGKTVINTANTDTDFRETKDRKGNVLSDAFLKAREVG